MKVGLGCLLAAVFFAIVAGGHVTLDARAEGPAAIGVVLTLFAAVACAFGITRRDMTGIVLIALSAAAIVMDYLIGGEMFATVRTLACVLVFGGLAYVLGTNRVVQIPTAVYAGFLALLVAAMGVSILVSEFKWVSIDAWLYWLTYGAAFYLTVATVGRVKGPRLLLETIVLATTLVAIKGIIEFLVMRANEPTYRIFADWNNPNALAGLLAMVVPLALGLGLVHKGTTRIVSYTGATLMTTALVLTASKGGLLAFAIGLFALLFVLLAWKGGKRTAFVLVPLVASALVIGVLQATTPKTKGTALSRVTASSGEQAQSLTYRKLLWQSTVELTKKHPVGFGAGTFRYYAAKPGLTEQTQLAHQSFLQIAMEGGWIAFVGILGLAVAWTIRMFKGAKALDPDRNLLRAAVFASVVTAGANAFLESNIFFFGTGVLLFVLLALGLQLAADGTSPESMPAPFRGFIVASCCVAPLAIMVWIQWVENAKTSVYNGLEAQDRQAVESSIQLVSSVGAFDGTSWYLQALLEPSDAKRLSLLKRAVALAPTTRNYRMLADTLEELGNTRDAITTLDQALFFDPNNLRTLTLKLEFQDRTGNIQGAQATAKRIIAIEQTPYLQVRALPEYVPTEPLQARVYLAHHTTIAEEKIKLLREALDGYLRYRSLTVPKVVAFNKEKLEYAGDSLTAAMTKMDDAHAVAEELIALYRSSGKDSEADEVGELAKGLTVD